VAILLSLSQTGALSNESGFFIGTTSTIRPAEAALSGNGPTTTTSEAIYTHDIGVPQRIVIESIGVDATIMPVGLQANGDMEMPHWHVAGWFKYGPTPGAQGPAVIVGHLDSKHGEDVFYHLTEVSLGDEIQVMDAQGNVAVFAVDSEEKIRKINLPTERIWPETSQPLIRLITCTGFFDKITKHYISNFIVYGHLVR